MGTMVAVVIGLVVMGVILAFLLGVAVIIGASDDLYRELDDRDQEEYIRRWVEEKKKRDARKIARRRKR